MTTIIKKTLSTLTLPVLMVTLTTLGMEIEQFQPHNTRSTINAIVYFHPTKPASYATDQQITYLNEKGITKPTLPIIRHVSHVKVLETDGTTTNWLEKPTQCVQKYEETELKQKHLSFGQGIHQGLAIQNKTFPRFLPTELLFNCSNNSKITLSIEQYPVHITFASENNFLTEHEQSMLQFFRNPSSYSSQNDLAQHVSAGLLNKNIVPVILSFIDPITQEEDHIYAERAAYNHGKKGCPNMSVFITRLVRKQTSPNRSVHKYLFNRQINGK